MKWRGAIAVGAGLALIAAGWAVRSASAVLAPAQAAPVQSFEVVHAGDGLVRWVVQDGRIPGGPVTIDEGIIEIERGDDLRVQVNATHGQQVEVGDVVATVTSSRAAAREVAEEADRRAREAELALVVAGGRPEDVQWAEREVQVAHSAVEQARRQAQRVRDLTTTGAASAWEAEDADLVLALREAELALATAGIGRAALAPREEDLARARAEVDAAAANLELARAARAYETIESPLRGRVDQPGGFVLVRVTPDEPPWLQIALDASTASRVKPGDPVTFQPASGGPAHEGTVVTVGHEARAVGTRAVIWATAEVTPPVSPGTLGQARIRRGRRE